MALSSICLSINGSWTVVQQLRRGRGRFWPDLDNRPFFQAPYRGERTQTNCDLLVKLEHTAYVKSLIPAQLN